jgi:hypothetical protein
LRNIRIQGSGSKNFGGVIASSKNSEVYINDSSIVSCYAEKGGAIWSEKTLLFIINTNITDCKTSIQGGHLYIKKSNFTLRKVNLINAFSLSAASIYGELVFFDFLDVIIYNCSSSLSKGIGSMYVTGVEKTINNITNFSCDSNKAMTGACLFAQDIKISMKNSNITNNYAASQSVIEVYYSTLNTSLQFEKVRFERNSAEKYILNVFQSYLDVFNCEFLNNPAKVALIVLGESDMFSSNNRYLTNKILDLQNARQPYYIFLREGNIYICVTQSRKKLM